MDLRLNLMFSPSRFSFLKHHFIASHTQHLSSSLSCLSPIGFKTTKKWQPETTQDLNTALVNNEFQNT